MAYLIVFLGAGIGGSLRHFANITVMHMGGQSFAGTAIVNITGSFVMGLIAEYFALRGHLPPHWRLFLATGVLGGYTTFSAFSLDTVLLYERGQLGTALAYLLGSNVLSILGLFAALRVVRLLVRG
jgi:CrcB protein